jgi:hypothetical protein
VWNYHQQPDESVEEYLNNMDKKLSKIEASTEQKRHAIINGLRPNIRQQVLQHEINSTEDIRRWSVIAESSEVKDSNTSVASALKELQDQIGRLQVRSMSHEKSEARPRSPSPRPRVHFSSNETPYRSVSPYRNDQNRFSQFNRYPRSYPRSTFQNRGSSDSGRGTWHRQYQPHSSRSYQGGYRPAFNPNVSTNSQFSSQNGTNQICFKCGKANHIARFCRSVRQ